MRLAVLLSAFARLRELLHGIAPPRGLDPVALQLGEPRLGAPPTEAFGPLAEVAGWTRYPPLGGTSELRAAYTGWLQRRFGVPVDLTGGPIVVEPTPGAKQAVATAIALAVASRRGERDPAVVMPNPGYPTYHAAAGAAGARPVFYRSGVTPPAIAAAVHAADGPVAAIIVCNPGNPCGEVLSAETLRDVAMIAVEAQAVLIVDECYTDLFLGRVPAGYLSLWSASGAAPGPFLVLHSLSKRSGAPGLRSGFVAGDPATVASYARDNRACGVSTPLPVCAVAAALWADDIHVSRLRSALARNWALADTILGVLPSYRRAEAGFFLWLPVPDDEATARELWRRYALSVMPGRYLATDATGGNPGIGHLRIALVHDEPTMREALTRLRQAMTGNRELTA